MRCHRQAFSSAWTWPPQRTIIVEDIEHLNKDLQRGNYFYADIEKEGVLLFDNGRHTLAEAVPLDPVESQKHVRDRI